MEQIVLKDKLKCNKFKNKKRLYHVFDSLFYLQSDR